MSNSININRPILIINIKCKVIHIINYDFMNTYLVFKPQVFGNPISNIIILYPMEITDYLTIFEVFCSESNFIT